MHLFLSCPFALSCWSQVDLIPSVNGVSSFLDWFFMFLTNVDKEVVGRVGSIIWGYGGRETPCYGIIVPHLLLKQSLLAYRS